jgi:3-hydroxyacyl-[acyl-carrier-protein] dehydratase
MEKYDRVTIKSKIPHREPMLLVDDVEIISRDPLSTIGHYTVRGDEFFLQGHFPGNPVVPGVILCEMMAQSCCPVIDEGKTPYFTSLNNVKFKQMVKPGDTIRFECVLLRRNGPFHFVTGKGFVGDKIAIQAELSFATF